MSANNSVEYEVAEDPVRLEYSEPVVVKQRDSLSTSIDERLADSHGRVDKIIKLNINSTELS